MCSVANVRCVGCASLASGVHFIVVDMLPFVCCLMMTMLLLSLLVVASSCC
jgi:hypothetical protein